MPTSLGASMHARTPSNSDAAPRSSSNRARRSMTSPQAGPDDLFYSLANADSATEQRRRSRPGTSGRQSGTNISSQARAQASERRQSATSIPQIQTQWISNGTASKFSPATPGASDNASGRPSTRSGSQRTTPASHSRFASADWAARFGRPTPPSRQTSDQNSLVAPAQNTNPSSPYANMPSTPSATSAYRAPPHGPRSSSLVNSNNNNNNNHSSQADVDENESVGSTAAPSTVWDELGELKSRIRQLELSGGRRRPGTSGTTGTQSYVEYSDRPRTGTTQTTDVTSPNLSYSSQAWPKQLRQTPSEELHPLLREALGKARSRLDANTYRFLESSVFDSLELASMARGLDAAATADNMSSITGTTTNSGSIERRMRRKADNVCRSLTELCIAMCENRPSTSNVQSTRYASHETLASRPGSRDHVADRQTWLNGSSPVEPNELRRAHTERLDAASRPSPRLASRLESRRSSAAAAAAAATYLTPEGAHTSQAAQRMSGYAVNRMNSDDDESTLRGSSRAMTEVNARDRSARQMANGYAGLSPTIRERLLANRSNSSLVSAHSTRNLVPDASFLASPTSEAPTERNSTDSAILSPGGGGGGGGVGGVMRRPSSSRRAPPSAAANLAERLEAKRQQRVATAGQLGTATPTSSVSGSLAGLKRADSRT